MKKLLMVVPSLSLGGQERVAAKTAELLVGQYEVSIAVFDRTNAVFTPPCEVIDLNIPPHPNKLGKVWNVLRRAAKLKKLRREQGIDFVYSFNGANLPNVLSRGTGKTIISLHGYRTASSTSPVEKYTRRKCDRIVCCAEEMCRTVKAQSTAYAEKTDCLYNPLDCGAIAAQGQESVDDYAFSAHTVISHGRLDSVKNWPRLIKAFSLVHAKLPDAQLVIIGEGGEREALERLIGGLGLRDSVRLIGFRANPFAYLARASLFVLSSYSEGLPSALMEGMVFLPVVSADCKSGPREILSTGPMDRIAQGYEITDYGVLVQPASDRAFHAELTRDDEILSEAMLRVLEDPALSARLKAAARRRAEDFSCESYRAHLMKLLEEPVKGGCE